MKGCQGPRDQLWICTQDCGARCCRYLTVSVPAPRGTNDWDEFRWWLAHGGIMVTKDDDGWMLHVETRCRHLGADNACGIYADRMIACEDYDAANCEFTDEVPYDVCFRKEEDLADYLEKRRLKRGAAVAQSIRAAALPSADDLPSDDDPPSADGRSSEDGRASEDGRPPGV